MVPWDINEFKIDHAGSKRDSVHYDWPIRVENNVENNTCEIILWDETTLEAPKEHYREIDAFVGDFEYLLNHDSFYAIKYDPDSFSSTLVVWLQTVFEPAVNCLVKRRLITIDCDDQDFVMLNIFKNKTTRNENDENSDDEEVINNQRDYDEQDKITNE